MNQNFLRRAWMLLVFASTTLQAQSWLDWQDYSQYVFPEKALWIFPKNIESFRTAHMQIWVNNQWRDSFRFNNTFNGTGVMQTSKAEAYTNGQWVDEGNVIYTYNGTGGLTQLRIGFGTPPAFLPIFRLTNTLGTGGRIEKTLGEDFDLGTASWSLSSLDSNVYAPSGRQSHYYNSLYNATLNRWELYQKDSLTYDAAGRVDKTLIEEPITGFPNVLDGRYVRTYNAAGKMTQLRYDVPQLDANGMPRVPFAWDSLTNATRMTYVYNAQNQLIQLNFEGADISNNPTTTMARYRFTVDANGKVLEELNDEFNGATQAWVNVSKTVYTYYRVGTAEIIPNELLTVSPNPVQAGQLHLSLENAGGSMESVELYDLYGRLVLNQKVDNQQVIDFNLANLNNGQYLLKVKTDKGLISKKILFLN
jgi:Secretion system C-terminal sorting domain